MQRIKAAPQCFQGNDWQSFALLSMAYCTMRTMLIISICHQGLHCLHRGHVLLFHACTCAFLMDVVHLYIVCPRHAA